MTRRSWTVATLALTLAAGAAWAGEPKEDKAEEAVERLLWSRARDGLGSGVKNVKAAYLGVATVRPQAALAKQLKLPEGVGLVVNYVDENGPAREAGLQVHDLLFKLDDQYLVNEQQFVTLVRMHKPGEKVELTIIREGAQTKATATLIEKEVPALEVYGWGGSSTARDPTQFLQWSDRPGGSGVKIIRRSSDLLPGLEQGMALNTSRMTFADEEHTLELSQKGGQQHLVAKDKDGNVLYDGLLPEDRTKLPEAVRGKLDNFDMLMHESDNPFAIVRFRKAEALQKDAEKKGEDEKGQTPAGLDF
jgi:hypothetical protein